MYIFFHVQKYFASILVCGCLEDFKYMPFLSCLKWGVFAGDACTGDVVMFEQNVYEM